eukprot:TRINITY_DN35023_c0_g1_i1.p1 TRINITY_DN35023_c0_g1~~TRINITY_DN35023_c0_g1_i1.p1  ORF type:complete len:248 (+),score=36.27 TRINITY_DN35023_c0_g1_i1:80-823(+)
MFTLFRCFTDGCDAYDGTPVAEKLRKHLGAPYVLLHVPVTMLVTVGIFNMIMAMFIETAMASALRRKQRELSENAVQTETHFKRMIAQIIMDPSVVNMNPRAKRYTVQDNALTKTDPFDRFASEEEFEKMKQHGVTVTRHTFEEWLRIPSFVQMLEKSEIDVTIKHDLFDILDSDMGGLLELDELVTGLMKLRGPVSKNDIIATRLKVRHICESTNAVMSAITPADARESEDPQTEIGDSSAPLTCC